MSGLKYCRGIPILFEMAHLTKGAKDPSEHLSRSFSIPLPNHMFIKVGWSCVPCAALEKFKLSFDVPPITLYVVSMSARSWGNKMQLVIHRLVSIWWVDGYVHYAPISRPLVRVNFSARKYKLFDNGEQTSSASVLD